MSPLEGDRVDENENETGSNNDKQKKDEKLDRGDDSDGENDSDEEDEEAYRLRVYGTKSQTDFARASFSGPMRRFSKRLSTRVSRSLMRRRSSLAESLPDTPTGWMVLSSLTMSAILAYEVRLQKSLTKPPITFSQLPAGGYMEKIYKQLTDDPFHGKTERSTSTKILSRTIQPSLFVGTRGMVSSTAAYLGRGPSSRINYLRFREIFTMSQDGARIAIDWEVREDSGETKRTKQDILNGPIRKPVVIILHGINNDASFGYMKSLSRSFCNRGYISASMNFRGCGHVKLSTPRGYTAAYTGDLRSLVNQISARLDNNVSVFLVGNSLGANIMTKYLGEEGRCGTLPSCISGGVALGNPLLIDSSIVKFPFNILMALGVKKIYLENVKQIIGMNDARSLHILKKGFMAPTIAAFDNAIAPAMVRNNPYYPFETKIGYEDGDAYWFDSSSYRYIKYISVPFLNLSAQDDFLVSKPSRNKLGFCLANPNVMVVETRCGGHLGWHETPPDSAFGASSWADTAASDFFDAILKTSSESLPEAPVEQRNDGSESGWSELSNLEKKHMQAKLKKAKAEALAFTKSNRSRL